MRGFEIGLLIVTALTPLFGFGRTTEPTRRWVASGGVLLLVAHGIVEGFRYQMSFSYILVLLAAAAAWMRRGKPPRRSKRWIAVKGVGTTATLALVALTAFLANALPVFTLPGPTGSHDVGVAYYPLVDDDRKDPFLDRTPKKRELMIKVYYPAQDGATGSKAPYFRGSKELIRQYASFYEGLPPFAFDHLLLVKTHALENVPLSDRLPSYPVVLFSHGAGATMEIHTAQCEDLASHGYIVVAIDHTYVSAATEFPDRIATHREATTDFQVVEPAAIISRIMADDAAFVLDRLTEMNAGTSGNLFHERMDLDRVGVVGHSVGGAAAYRLALTEPRVKAAIDLDGFVYMTPEEGAGPGAPFLMAANDEFHIRLFEERKGHLEPFATLSELDRQIMREIYGSEEAYEEAARTATRNLLGVSEVAASSGRLFTIRGSSHMKFTDQGLFIGIRSLRELAGIGGDSEPEAVLAAASALTAAFFDRHLKDRPEETILDLLRDYPIIERSSESEGERQ